MTMTMMNIAIDNNLWRWRWHQTSLKFWWSSNDDLAVSVNDAAPWTVKLVNYKKNLNSNLPNQVFLWASKDNKKRRMRRREQWWLWPWWTREAFDDQWWCIQSLEGRKCHWWCELAPCFSMIFKWVGKLLDGVDFEWGCNLINDS